MKKSLLYIVPVLATMLLGSSCSKGFLELEPKTGQVEANYYKTEDQAFLGVTAVYDAYSVQNWQFVPVMSDIWSDDAFCGGANINDMSQWHDLESFKMTPENNSASDLWNRCYSGIYRANLYLQKQGGVTWVTDGLKERYEGEVKFLRAYFYWDLVRNYGWAPLITEVLPDVEDYKNIPQNTPEEIFTQIAGDLLDAVDVLPTEITAAEKGRISQAAVQALMARIYLYHTGMSAISELGITAEHWTNGTTTIDKTYIQTALGQIILNEKYYLLPDYADIFDWENQNNDESILEIQYSEKAKSGDWGGWNINGNFSSLWLSPRNPKPATGPAFPGWSLDVPTWNLADEFEAGDPRKEAILFNAETELTGYTKAFMNTGYFNRKYMALKAYEFTGGDPQHNFPRNFIDIRYADVLLMAAEVWLNDDADKALGYLNEVRKRALGESEGLLSINLDAIYHERRCEFAGEGLRKWDLLRRGLSYAEGKINGSFVVPSEIPNPADFTARTFKANTWGMFPIPASEIRNTNAGMLKQMVPAYQ